MTDRLKSAEEELQDLRRVCQEKEAEIVALKVKITMLEAQIPPPPEPEVTPVVEDTGCVIIP